MLGTDDIIALAVTSLLWIAALAAFVMRRRTAARWLAMCAGLASFVTIVLLHLGTGRRA